MGAIENNVNAVKHGLRSKRFGLIMAKPGKRFGSAYADVCRLRREIETIMGSRNGGPTLSERAKAQTILR